MAHVHGAAVAAQASKHAAHSAQHAHHAAHAAHHAAEAAHVAAGHNMVRAAAPAATSFHNLAKGAVTTGTVATAGTRAGRSFLGKVFGHPLVLFGLGVAVGYTLHKYRKEIIESANRAAEQSKDFVLQQRENLEDLVAETGEAEV